MRSCTAGRSGLLLATLLNRMPNRFLPSTFFSLIAVVFLGLATFASPAVAVETPATPANEEHEALSLKAEELYHVGKFTLTNSMLVTWIVAAGMIVFAQTATRKIKPMPTGAQNFWEWLVESLYNFLESVIGSDLVEKDVLVFRHDLHLHSVLELVRTHSRRRHDWLGPSIRRTDLSCRSPAPARRETRISIMTYAMAMHLLRAAGSFGRFKPMALAEFIKHIFGPKGETTGLLKAIMVVIFSSSSDGSKSSRSCSARSR